MIIKRIPTKMTLLKKFLSSLDRHPCDFDQTGICCFMGTNMIGNNLNGTMRVMRHSIRRGRSHLNLSQLLASVIDSIDYPLMVNKADLKLQKDSGPKYINKIDINSMIPQCEHLNPFVTVFEENYHCDVFDTVVTDTGICHAFNPMQTVELLKQSYFLESFESAFKEDYLRNRTKASGIGSGADFALNFWLADTSMRSKEKTDETSFRVALTSHNDYFDMKTTSHKVKPGYHTIWKVSAMEIVASNDLHKVPTKLRQCKFHDETEDLQIFKVYSKSACEFECKIKRAAEICRCTPWNVPNIPQDGRHVLCDIHGNYCFRRFMNDGDVRKNCSCLPSCHHIEFDYNEQLNPLETTLCDRLNEIPLAIANEMMDNGYNSLAYKLIKIREWQESGSNESVRWDEDKIRRELCIEMLSKHMAKVSVMFNKNTYIRTKTSLKVSFTDKLAVFGM